MNTRTSWFMGEDGRSLVFTFSLVSTLFLLWGFCNGLIDVMDKHFQDELHLTKAQSAWVQTAHYLGYALMALPAGMIARAIGYKGASSPASSLFPPEVSGSSGQHRLPPSGPFSSA